LISYFTGVHDPKDEPEFKGTVEFSFEYDEKISLIDLKLMIIEYSSILCLGINVWVVAVR
jgi:hypothetical protein